MRFQSTTNRALENRLKQERKLTINVVLMCLFFNLSWISYAIVSILRTSGYQVSPTVMAVAVLLTKRFVNLDFLCQLLNLNKNAITYTMIVILTQIEYLSFSGSCWNPVIHVFCNREVSRYLNA